MKCSYDDWTTKVVKSINPRMRRVLTVMTDGECRTRATMLWAAGIDPNPRTASGYAGNERTDYYLYKKGLLSFVWMEGQQKVFQITAAGLEELQK
jgi:hypothetical protein